MSPTVSPEDPEDDHGGKKEIEYSFTVKLEGLSQEESDSFVEEIDGCMIRTSPGQLFLYPLDEVDFDGSAGAFLQDILSRYGKVFETAARIGISREISLAIYFDANRIAAICPSFDSAVIRQLADLNFSLEICVFPSSFEDDEGTEE